MAYSNLSEKFDSVKDQYNILAIIGNGFDIQALSDLGSPTDTRYESFYHYLKYRRFNPRNRLLQKMEDLRVAGATNWSDVENAISVLLAEASASTSDIADDLAEIQREFSSFLDQVATPGILSELGDRSVAGKWTITSFTSFLGDIADPDEYNKMLLPKKMNIGDLFNFQFVNFNYTALLDDYVYLDQIQFDPHPYRHSDRNISFHPNPRGHAGSTNERQEFRMVSYLVSDVVHPHGIQYTPRSLLFGIDTATGPSLKLSKPYWAQNEVKYGELFAKTDLFIIFGCSLGETDGWWWRAIAKSLTDNPESELIIYWRRAPHEHGLSDQGVRDKFFEVAHGDAKAELSKALLDRARVVLYDDSTERAWLNTNRSAAPNWA